MRACLALLCAGAVLWSGAGSAFGAVAVDKTVTTHQGSAAKTISSPSLTTAAPEELLLAFITSDGPSGGGSMSFSSVTGGGRDLAPACGAPTRRPGRRRSGRRAAPAVLTNAKVTATRSSGSYAGSITVVALSGADLVADGASATASAATGAPSVTVTTTRAGSWVWGVGQRLGPGHRSHGRRRADEGRRVPRPGRGHDVGAAPERGDTVARDGGDPERHRADQRPLEPRRGRGAARGHRQPAAQPPRPGSPPAR